MGFVLMGGFGLCFVAREKEYSGAEFAAFITAFLGGAVLQIYTTELDPDTKVLFWLYAVGLLAGLLLYHHGTDNDQKWMRIKIRQ